MVAEKEAKNVAVEKEAAEAEEVAISPTKEEKRAVTAKKEARRSKVFIS